MKQPIAEILSQGDELVTGEIADTNAAWLSRELTVLGFEVARHTAVGDRLEALVELLREIAGRAELCLCSGGLGPTCDDLTAEAVSLAFGLPLELDGEALARIGSWFDRMGRPMPEVNRKQALLPRGAERLDNFWGTAPGFSLTAGRCRFAFMPGVPGEMRAMFRYWLRPELPRRFTLQPARLVVLHTIGMGESALQERLDSLALPAGIGLGFRAGGAENRVKLLFPADWPAAVRNEWVRRVADSLGEAVYAMDEASDDPLRSVTGQAFTGRNASFYAAETASGGVLSSRCSGEPWFLGAVLEAEPASLPQRLGVAAAETPQATARRLAERARVLSGADYALVQYGDFDQAALRSETRRIELRLALAGPNGTREETGRTLAGGLSRKQHAAAALSLDFVRRCLLSE